MKLEAAQKGVYGACGIFTPVRTGFFFQAGAGYGHGKILLTNDIHGR